MIFTSDKRNRENSRIVLLRICANSLRKENVKCYFICRLSVAMSRVVQKSPAFFRIAESVYRTGSLCLVLDKLDGVAGVVAHERERNARVVVEFKDYFHTIGLQ